MLCPCCERSHASIALVAKPGGQFACSKDHTFQFVSPNADKTGRYLEVSESPDRGCRVGEQFPIPDVDVFDVPSSDD